MSFPSGVLILSDEISQRDQGTVSSLVNTVVNFSISMGLGFAGIVERQVLESNSGAAYG
jgi:hypothetical protein